jgi:hypothetical protein
MEKSKGPFSRSVVAVVRRLDLPMEKVEGGTHAAIDQNHRTSTSNTINLFFSF